MAITAVAATGLLTFSDVGVDTQTVIVGGKTYTLLATLIDADGNVQLGAAGAADETIDNLYAAINLGGTPGTEYAASMTKNEQVRASAESDTILTVTALSAGSAGNWIPSTETCTNAAWGAVTLENGTGGGGDESIAAELSALRTESTFAINAGVIEKLVTLETEMGYAPA